MSLDALGLDRLFVVGALLLLAGVLAGKLSDRYGIPALVLFLLVGMLAGSDGPGGIAFDNPARVQAIGMVALILILFAGGLGTRWKTARTVLRPSLFLATAGVVVTAFCVALLATAVAGLSLEAGLLLGAIVSSTDAAAVFSILRAKSVRLPDRVATLLEFESGSNDPMAVLLTVGLVEALRSGEGMSAGLLVRLLAQLPVGVLAGFLAGRGTAWFINRIHLAAEGLYPALTLGMVFLTYGVTSLLGGSGFLAVYVAAIVMGNSEVVHRRSIGRFHDGIAWLMQIVMFLTLGLQVFPSHLWAVAGVSLLLAAGLMLVARPLGVFLCLWGSGFTFRQQVLIAWVGLRGAVPIVLATYPLMARLPQAEMIFNVVFFVVVASVMVQGTSLAPVARWLKVEMPTGHGEANPAEGVDGLQGNVREVAIAPGSRLDGVPIVAAGFPPGFFIVLVRREGEFLQPSGSTVLRSGDVLTVLGPPTVVEEVRHDLAGTVADSPNF